MSRNEIEPMDHLLKVNRKLEALRDLFFAIDPKNFLMEETAFDGLGCLIEGICEELGDISDRLAVDSYADRADCTP